MRKRIRAALVTALVAALALPGSSAYAANAAPVPQVLTSNLTVGEGKDATATGHVLDPDLDGVDLSADVGFIYGAGPTGDGGFDWWWTWTAPDGPAEQDVTLTFSDSNGGVATVTLHVTINNLAPIVTVTGSRYVSVGTDWRSFSYTSRDHYGDPSPVITASCDGAVLELISTATESIACDEWPEGPHTVSVTSTDLDGDAGTGSTQVVATPLVRRADSMDTVIAGGPTFGGSLAVADLNGDGVDDLAVGTGSTFSGDPPPGFVGSVRVFLGPIATGAIDVTGGMGVPGFAITAASPDDQLGRRLASAGDVNGDGIDDLVIAAPHSDSGGVDTGSVWIVFGSHALPHDISLATAAPTEAIRFDGAAASDELGFTVAGGGDLNGDGFDDVVLGAHSPTGGARVFVVQGASTLAGSVVGPPLKTVRINADSTSVGLAIATMDADGFADLVVAESNRVTTVYGSSTLADLDLKTPPVGTVSTIAESSYATLVSTSLNVAVADVDGDGIRDIVVGRQRAFGSTRDVGAAIVYFGRLDRISRSAAILGPADALHIRGDQTTGYDVAAGDLDGDGRAELIDVGWKNIDRASGAAYVIAPTSMTADIELDILDGQWRRIDGWSPGDGDAVVGDVNGDGALDAIVGWSPVSRVTILAGTPPPDTTAPVVTNLTEALSAGSTISGGRGEAAIGPRVMTRIVWSGSDAGSGIDHYQVQRSTDGGGYVQVGRNSLVPMTVLPLPLGHTYRLRVRAIDRAGNIGGWTYGSSFKLTGAQDGAARYSGTWTTATSDVIWWGGTTRSSTTKNSTASYAFTGRSIAWVSARGPDRGKAAVYVDGVLKATIDLFASRSRTQVVVWSMNFSASVKRTVTIKVLGTTGRPRVSVDGFVVRS